MAKDMVSRCAWGNEVRKVDEDCLGQLSRRWKSCERKKAGKGGASLGGRAGRDDDYKLNVFCDTQMGL